MDILENLPPSIVDLIEPAFLMYMAIEAYLQLLITGLWQNRSIPSNLRATAFGKFWSKVFGTTPDPDLPVVGSAAFVRFLLAQARGVVLEVGPGSGSQARFFDAAEGQIRAVYGAEPVAGLHRLIQQNVDDTLIGPKYTILGADATRDSIAHHLVKSKVIESADDAEGVFDTIVCVRVLCSVPDLEGTIKDLHALLRSGGKLLVCEHTVNPWRTPEGRLIARLAQSLYMLLGWSYFIGDCSLTRDTETVLRKDALSRWESIDVKRHFGTGVFSYISGALVKR